jgi:DGQHR domain-containing protein
MSENSIIKNGNIYIKGCIVGPNLNLTQIRGFAPLNVLADISGADVYDQEKNPHGTQRDLKPAHAKEASSYALAANDRNPGTDPRAFPEILLNVRDTSVVRSYVNSEPLEFSSLEGSDELFGRLVDLEIQIDLLNQPPATVNPQISRVDGNHRLSRIPSPSEREEGAEYPIVPFALFVGLTPNQERKLFRDINGLQQGMNTSHLDQITMELEADNLLLDSKSRPLWFAQKMSDEEDKENGIFSELVFKGGSKIGVKEKLGFSPPLNLATLRSMMQASLREMDALVIEELTPELLERAKKQEQVAIAMVRQAADDFLALFARFWKAVRENYPEAWADNKKTKYILFSSIGALSLSQLAGTIITELVRQEKHEQVDFDKEVARIKNGGITLLREDFQGFAGMAGAKKVYDMLIAARVDGSSGLKAIRGGLRGKESSQLED